MWWQIRKYRDFDFFRKHPEMRINNQESHTTYLGALLSTIIMMLLIAAGYFFGREVIQKNFPITVSSVQYVVKPPMIDVGEQIFPMAFGLQTFDEWQHYRDERIYQIQLRYSVVQKQQKSDGNWINQFDVITLNPVPCDRQKHFTTMGKIQEFVTKMDMENLYCLPKELDQMTIGGNFDLGQYRSLQLRLVRCRNGVKNVDGELNNCQSDGEIEDHLQKGYFVLYFPDHGVDESQSRDPLQVYGRSYFTTISLQHQKEIQVNLKTIDLQIDNGWLIEDYTNQQKVSLDSWREMLSNFDDTIFELNIQASNYQYNFSFTYTQVQQVIADIGGFMDMIMATILFFVTPLIDADYHEMMVNSIIFQKIKKRQFLNQSCFLMDSSYPDLQDSEQNQSLAQPQGEGGGVDGVYANQPGGEKAGKNSSKLIRDDDSVRDLQNNSFSAMNTFAPENQKEQRLHSNKQQFQLKDPPVTKQVIRPMEITVDEEPEPQNLEQKDLPLQIKLQSKLRHSNTNSTPTPLMPSPTFSKKSRTYIQNEKGEIVKKKHNIYENQIDQSLPFSKDYKSDEQQKKAGKKIHPNERSGLGFKSAQEIYRDALQQMIAVKKDVVQLSACDHFRFYPCFTCGHQKAEIVEVASGFLEQQLDLYTVIKYFNDIDKLQKIILTQQQLKIFEYMQKPTVNIQDEEDYIGSDKKKHHHNFHVTIDDPYQIDDPENFNEIDQIIQYYQLLKSQQKESVSKRICDLLDQDFANIMEEICQIKDRDRDQNQEIESPVLNQYPMEESQQIIPEDNENLKIEEQYLSQFQITERENADGKQRLKVSARKSD